MKPVKISSIIGALLFTILTASFAGGAASEDLVYNLDNGLEVILRENHSSPMIASIVFVRSGSKYESRFENGITHFLEHLLFDGTTNLSREELDQSIRNLGGMINAFTRKEVTAYLVLMPKQYFDYGLTVQADMLFNSVFPEDELAKERKVVIEEINRDKDAAGSAAEVFFIEKAYAGTDYNRPVLGYRSFIENIPREAIIDYWRRYYVPKNMTALIIGDFDTEAMKSTIQSVLGGINDTTVRASTYEPVGDGSIAGQTVFDTVANVESTYLNFSFEAPTISDSDYIAMDLLAQYLSMDDISPLMVALKGGGTPLVSEASVSLTTYKEFSRLEISAICENPDNADMIVSTVLQQLKAIPSHSADKESLQGIKTSVKCNDIYYSEKLYFLGFIIAPMMMSGGWDFLQTYPDELDKVEWDQCRRVAARWLTTPDYVATIVKPAGDSPAVPYQPYEMPPEEVTAHFDSAQFAPFDTTGRYQLAYPGTDSVSFELSDPAEYIHEVLDNGLTVIIKSNPDTRVFALNVIGKNRTAAEPEGKAGITDFVNRCIEKGTLTRDAAELSRDLAKTGANVTLYDNPWIPYDDRYTTQRFSFMKFETIDEFAEKGFHLFTEMILYPSFDSIEVENVRRSMLGVLGRDSGSPSKVARALFYATLFEGTAYANPIMGSPRTVGTITIEDLQAHHARMYSPGNMILSIVTSRPASRVKQWVDDRYGRLMYPAVVVGSAEAPEPMLQTKSNHTDLDKEQVSIYLGCGLPAANHYDAAAIEVATTILSNRLYLNLREKQGLAYSIGADATFDRDFGWFYASIGTASPNYRQALEGILLHIDKLRYDGPTEEEVSSARNQIWGSLMRAKLASINQAYYLGVDNYLGLPLEHDAEFLRALTAVDVAAVRRAASKYFRTDAYALATAGKLP